MVKMRSMKKEHAIELLGGSVSAAASAMGITYQAVDKWPENLPQRIADRVLGVWVRKEQPEVAAQAAPDLPAPAAHEEGSHA